MTLIYKGCPWKMQTFSISFYLLNQIMQVLQNQHFILRLIEIQV